MRPSQDLAAVVESSQQGTTFCLDPGTFEVTTSIDVKAGQGFIGAGVGVTVVRGDVAIPGAHWSKPSGLWMNAEDDALPEPLLDTKECIPGNVVCNYQDDLNRADTGEALERVLSPCSTEKVVGGTYCIDYRSRTIYMADNPASFGGVTYTVVPAGFLQASDTFISDLSILHFAGTAVAIGTNSTATRIEVAFAHNTGVMLSSIDAGRPATLTSSHLHDNGLKGGGGATDSGVFNDNEVDQNGWAGFAGPEGSSGVRFSAANDLTIRGNNIHDNIGNGLWLDVQTQDVTATGNVMARNLNTLSNEGWLAGGFGIQMEKSCHILLQDNTIFGNERSAINATNPWDLSIFGNTISGNGRGIHLVDDDSAQQPGVCMPQGGNIVMRDVVVSNNDITMDVGYSGFVVDGVPLNPTNSFANNTYHVPNCREGWWVLADDQVLLTWPQWQLERQDTSGTCQD